MSECTSMGDYRSKFFANQKLSGFGLDTTMHIPCAFCAEPDWLVHRIIDAEKAYDAGAVCKHCGRGARGIITHNGGVSVEFVQISGPDAPSWLVPTMRRVYAS
jgi:hypothetical protein